MYLVLGCHCVIGLVFAASAIGKLKDSAEFVRTTRTLLDASRPGPASRVFAGPLGRVFAGSAGRGFAGLVGRVFAGSVGVFVIGAEAAVPLLVLPAVTARVGMAVAAFLMAMFAVMIGVALRRGVRASCRCFGASTAPLGRRHLVRNGLLLCLALVGLIAGPGDRGSLHPAGLVVTVGAAAVLALLVVRLDDLSGLFSGTLQVPAHRINRTFQVPGHRIDGTLRDPVHRVDGTFRDPGQPVDGTLRDPGQPIDGTLRDPGQPIDGTFQVPGTTDRRDLSGLGTTDQRRRT